MLRLQQKNTTCYSLYAKLNLLSCFFGIILFHLFLTNKSNAKICDIFIILIFFVSEFLQKTDKYSHTFQFNLEQRTCKCVLQVDEHCSQNGKAFS